MSEGVDFKCHILSSSHRMLHSQQVSILLELWLL